MKEVTTRTSIIVRPATDHRQQSSLANDEGRTVSSYECDPNRKCVVDSQSRAMAASNDPRVQAALLDYFARLDQGERIDAEQFLAERPDISGELRSLIAFDVEARRLAGGSSPQPDSSAAPSATVLPVRPKVEVSTHSVVGQVAETSVAGKRKTNPDDQSPNAGSSGPNAVGLLVPSAPAFASLVRRNVAAPPSVPSPLTKSHNDLPESFAGWPSLLQAGCAAQETTKNGR